MCRRCGMTESEAKTMLEAYMECDRRKNDVAFEKQCHEDCDNCKLCYEQGTVGEHREAMNIAIKALENMEKIKEIISNSNQWSKEDVVVKAQAFCDIEKIVRSDEE